MFGVGRSKVRQALAKLAEAGIIEVARHRGATVAAPSRAQARHVFDLGAMLEPTIAGRLAENACLTQIERLRRHISQEDRARVKNNDPQRLRRSRPSRWWEFGCRLR